ncbi:H-NS histone family protein [Polaromonas glacialis]|uniref:H-NS histone family protein n=1 Tax=Polaromonas glacialis TaxID=866564 RepID=UPI00068F96FD|nr:H-NS histone family protein [Polaromonas glacialis]
MTQDSTLQQKIQEAEAALNELRKKLDEERKGERMQAISSAKELIKTHELTAADLGLLGKGSSAKRPVSDKRGMVAAKYQDHESGKTWTGRGKSPAWLAAQLAAGYSKDDFLIKS